MIDTKDNIYYYINFATVPLYIIYRLSSNTF